MPNFNPYGVQGSRALRRARRQLKHLLVEHGDTPCEVEGYEGLTNELALVKATWNLAIEGNAQARKDLWNRLYGRVPQEHEVRKTHSVDLSALSDEELLPRAEKALAKLKTRLGESAQQAEVVEAQVVGGYGIPLKP